MSVAVAMVCAARADHARNSLGLILTLAGVFKDIVRARPETFCAQSPADRRELQLLISGSVLAFGSVVTFVQVFGYSIALGGLVVFKTSGAK